MPEKLDPLDKRILTNQEKAKQERTQGFQLYQNIKITIIGATLGMGAFLIPWIWWLGSGKTAWSFAFGWGGSLVYVWLLSRSVENLANSSNSFRDWLGPARFAIVALLIITASKHREELELLPVFMGFLTYKIAAFVPLLVDTTKQDQQSLKNTNKTIPKQPTSTDSSSFVI